MTLPIMGRSAMIEGVFDVGAEQRRFFSVEVVDVCDVIGRVVQVGQDYPFWHV